MPGCLNTSTTSNESDQIKSLNDSQRVELAIKALQRGQEKPALLYLEQILAHDSKNKLARMLIKQITIPSEIYFGKKFKTYSIKKGDSLALLARKHLDNELKFYALAKYNQIADPSKLQLGKKIKIPIVIRQKNKADVPVKTVENIDKSSPFKQLLLDAEKLEGKGQFHLANQIWKQLEKETDYKTLAQKQIKLNLKKSEWLNTKEQLSMLLKNNETDSYFKLLKQSKINSLDKIADQQQWKNYVDTITDNYHKRAVSLYRQQNLEPAIALWDDILFLNPTFETAKIYKERANSLLQKLNEF